MYCKNILRECATQGYSELKYSSCTNVNNSLNTQPAENIIDFIKTVNLYKL